MKATPGQTCAMSFSHMEAVKFQFKNRSHAGQLLSEKLLIYQKDNPIVLALPQGGVPVAVPIARALKTKMDLLLVKKISAPGHPELAVGAIAEDGEPIWQNSKISLLNIPKPELDRLVVKARQSLYQQRTLWKIDSRMMDLKDQTVILVEDGLAAGSSLLAAIDFLKKRSPRKIILAIPVGSKTAIQNLTRFIDEVICLDCSQDIQNGNVIYEDFSDVSERAVTETMEKQALEQRSFWLASDQPQISP